MDHFDDVFSHLGVSGSGAVMLAISDFPITPSREVEIWSTRSKAPSYVSVEEPTRMRISSVKASIAPPLTQMIVGGTAIESKNQ